MRLWILQKWKSKHECIKYLSMQIGLIPFKVLHNMVDEF